MASMSSAPPRSIFSSSSSLLSSAPNPLGFGKFRYCYTRISQRNFVSCAITDATSVNWSQKNKIYIPNKVGIDIQQESDWYQLEADFNYWTRSLRPVQWYPGHIAKTKKN